jgi:GAF domain-containing protein
MAGLQLLNARVPHRYTAVYRLLDDELRCEHLVDKTGAATPDILVAVPLRDSFCQYVFREGVFVIEDSAKDRRLDGHPYQGTVAAYHAVPVLGGQGELRGTLCHLDTEPRVLPDSEIEYLQKTSRSLAAFLLP